MFCRLTFVISSIHSLPVYPPLQILSLAMWYFKLGPVGWNVTSLPLPLAGQTSKRVSVRLGAGGVDQLNGYAFSLVGSIRFSFLPALCFRVEEKGFFWQDSSNLGDTSSPSSLVQITFVTWGKLLHFSVLQLHEQQNRENRKLLFIRYWEY